MWKYGCFDHIASSSIGNLWLFLPVVIFHLCFSIIRQSKEGQRLVKGKKMTFNDQLFCTDFEYVQIIWSLYISRVVGIITSSIL